MKITLRIAEKCTPETTRSLIRLARSRAPHGVEVDLDLTVSQHIVKGLLEDEEVWEPDPVPSGLIPRLCKVLRAIDGGDESARKSAVADLKELLGVD